VVSTRIEVVERRMRGATSEKQRELARERRRLAKVATVLCAIRSCGRRPCSRRAR